MNAPLSEPVPIEPGAAEPAQTSSTAPDPTSGWRGLLWGVERSARYHLRREAHFEMLGNLARVVGIPAGTGAVFMAMMGQAGWIFGLLGTVAACALAGAVSASKRATVHRGLRGRFLDLQAIMQAPASEGLLQAATQVRLSIEKDEPPIFRALDIACHNGLMKAQGKREDDPRYTAHHYPLSPIQRATMNWIRWESLA